MKLNRKGSETRELLFTGEQLEFLELITNPVELPYDAPLPAFVRNETLREIRRRIQDARQRGNY